MKFLKKKKKPFNEGLLGAFTCSRYLTILNKHKKNLANKHHQNTNLITRSNFKF